MVTRLKTLFDSSVATEPMSNDTSEVFMNLCVIEMQDGAVGLPASELANNIRSVNGDVPFSVAVMIGRLEQAAKHTPDIRFTPQSVLLAAYLSPNVAMCVAWAYTLVEIARREPCTIGSMASVFPMGFPTEHAMNAYWDEQKQRHAPLGNRLDMAETWMPESATV